MSYTQNNPFSRKSSPLNKDDQWIQKATADIKKRGTEGVCTGDKFGGPTCPPGSKRYNLAKTFKSMAKDRKGGPSRESSEEKYMPIEDDMHKRGEGDMGMSRQPYGGNKGDEKRSVRDYEGVSRQPYGGNKGDEKKSVRDYEGPSRKSSEGMRAVKESAWSGGSFDPYGDKDPFDTRDERSGNRFPGVRKGQRDATTFIKSHPQYISKEKWANATDEQKDISSSPLNNTGMTGLNYSKELRYMPIEDDMHRGMSRESSSPLDYGSWAHEDAMRAKDLYKKGDYAHARALGIDEHDADYAKHWHRDEAEHGPSRKSRSERLRGRAMKRSERTGAEWGGYDYEDPRVQKMLAKARKLDERSGK
tara:strand:- start:16 stop:1098 length:1083 start_codon:yes stop_codon:yes gene_type:complete